MFNNWARCRQRREIMDSRAERIRDLSGLFVLSSILGLMPSAEDDSLNRRLTIYAVTAHVAYRITNIAVLVYFLMITKTSPPMIILLAVVSFMKFLCVAVHLVVVIKNRHQFVKLAENCRKSYFHRNAYRTIAKCGVLYILYLYVIAQVIQWRWQAVVRDVFSMLDVLMPILIILQFCTFLKIAADKFKNSRMRLVVLFYQNADFVDKILEDHLRNLDKVADLQNLYTHQLLCCICFLGFDFFVASYDTAERMMSGKNLIKTVTSTSYCTLCISTIMILGKACEATKKKAEKFDEELYMLMNDNHILRRNPKLKLYLKEKSPLNFTGSNFFDIGYPLVSKIIAATTTYIIFLTQFSDEE